ncbi:helix-turn-helix domain-containing protein [Roseomonas sp. WA12]
MAGLRKNNVAMEYFRPKQASILTTRGGRPAPIAIGRVRGAADDKPLSRHVVEDAFLFCLARVPCRADMTCDGRSMPVRLARPGQIRAYDYRHDWTCVLMDDFDQVNWHIPRSVFEALEPDQPGTLFSELSVPEASSIEDPVALQLANLLEPAFLSPEATNTLFIDHLCWAAVAHFGKTYGAYRPIRPKGGPRLSPWQERVAKDTIAARLDGEVRLADLAAACGLSVSHFARAFRATIGVPPHRWLLERRIDQAKALLANPRVTVAEVAAATGFSDQSHLSRVFSRQVGVPPASWRNGKSPRGP